MHDFFTMVSTAECRELLRGFTPVGEQTLPLADCHNRILFRQLEAPEDLPLVHRSCMDGYAVQARDLFGAGEGSGAYLQLAGTVHIEQVPDFPVLPGQCAAITTGGTLPEGADAVLMVEHSEDLGGGYIDGLRSLAPGDNVMLAGEDARKGEAVLGPGRRLRIAELGLLAALGITELPVFRRPVAGILSTGDELVPPHETPRPGQVRDVNTLALSCMVREAGAEARVFPAVPDQLEALTAALRAALEQCDLVFMSGGSSVGVRDLSIQALSALPDAAILAHGVAVSPGKPLIVARAMGKPVLGLPGQVASAQVVMLLFGQPLLRHLGGDPEAFSTQRRLLRRAELACNLSSRQGREDYVRVSLEERPGQLPLAWPRLGKSGLLKTLVQAQGLVCVEAQREGLPQGTAVEVWLL